MARLCCLHSSDSSKTPRRFGAWGANSGMRAWICTSLCDLRQYYHFPCWYVLVLCSELPLTVGATPREIILSLPPFIRLVDTCCAGEIVAPFSFYALSSRGGLDGLTPPFAVACIATLPQIVFPLLIKAQGTATVSGASSNATKDAPTMRSRCDYARTWSFWWWWFLSYRSQLCVGNGCWLGDWKEP
eukprot:SAG31_NODE_3900_length_3771_cov_17.031863_1_plen_187_part_00